MGKNSIPVHKPKTMKAFQKVDSDLRKRGYVALDILKPGTVRKLTLGDKDPLKNDAESVASYMGTGNWSSGPLSKVAWSFDSRDGAVPVKDSDGKDMGLGYVNWGPGNCTPSVIPPLAMASPYTAAPLRYIADLTTGLGPRLMYCFGQDDMCEFKYAGERLLREWEALKTNDNTPLDGLVAIPGIEQHKESAQEKRAREAYEEWDRVWNGYQDKNMNVPGAKQFLEDNNLDLHFMQCEQDDVMLDIYFPTVGFQKGRANSWGNPRIVRVGFLSACICRMELRDRWNYSNHVYVSDAWRTLGMSEKNTIPVDQKIEMWPAAMPQNMLQKLRDIVKNNQRTPLDDRPNWVVCPTFYPSANKAYYPQPAWWSIFTSKAYDFSSTILYDKAKQRENSTSWGKIFYISLDYLEQVFGDEGYQGNEDAQKDYIQKLEDEMEEFLKHRENHGKMMRQWMWEGRDGKQKYNVEIVDVADTKNDAVKAGKEELELSTSPIFLALQVDPRLVGVPMVAASNGGTALREMHLLKQQQLNPKQRLYLQFLNTIARYNQWGDHAEFHIVQQTLTTLDNSKTGTVNTVAGEKS